MSILVDTNILVYAAIGTADEHDAARAALDAAFDDPDATVGLCWSAVFGYARIASDRRILGDDAVDVHTAWRSALTYLHQPTARIIEGGARHAAIATELAAVPGLTSADVPDVHIASLAIEHGLELWTRDHGFARYPNLRWRDPIS